jgi:hypothetical protein
LGYFGDILGYFGIFLETNMIFEIFWGPSILDHRFPAVISMRKNLTLRSFWRENEDEPLDLGVSYFFKHIHKTSTTLW